MRRNQLSPPSAAPLLEILEPRVLLDAAAEQQALQLFSVSPALFVENQGQWADASVRYVHQGSGANVAMTDAGPVFQLFRQVLTEGEDKTPGDGLGDALVPDLLGPDRFDPDRYETQVLQFSASFVGANLVTPVGLDLSETQFNYFVGDQANWRSEVPAYEQVAYQGLYPGVDLLAQGLRSHLKYEFHVAPGADWSQIAVRYEGIAGLALAEDGSLRVSLGETWGEVLDDAPYAYQVIGDQRVAVAASFALLDATTYGFSITGAYDPTRELVIDPDLTYCTYLGAGGGDEGYGIAVDGSGSAYVTGYTTSTGLATAGAYQTTLVGVYDAFVAKFNSTGSGLVYCTYLGGGGYESGSGIAVDGSGSAYVTGYTTSTGLATAGAYQTTSGGGYDAFVAKLNSTGSGLAYLTYLGGGGYDLGSGIAVDGSGNAYVTGPTTDSTGLATPGAYQTTSGGVYDAFVAKLNSTGSGLAYCTYLGRSGNDWPRAIAVDGAGSAYVTGETDSIDFATAGAYQTTLGNSFDAFVAKLSSTGSGLVYCTYLGGGGNDEGYGIAVDGSGSAYVTGITYATKLATPGAYRTTFGGGYDAFVAKFNSTGSGLAYCTYLGGGGNDIGRSIAVDGSGSAYVTGQTGSSGMATAGAYQTTRGGSWDAFVAKLNSTGSGLAYGTYIGGSGTDYGYGIAVDGSGNVYVTGYTSSTGLATPGAYQTTYGGGFFDAFVAKILESPAQWTGAADDHWENAGNWSHGAVPGTGVVARIDGAAARQPVMEQDETVWGLDLAAGGTLTFAPGAPKTLVTKGLTIAETGGAPTARLDIGTGSLIVDYDDGAASPLEDVKRWVTAGYNGMTWTGNGLTSSAAAANPLIYGVGYAQNDMLFAPYNSFAGQAVDSSSVLVKYTYNGDLNLDGCVDDNDVSILGLYYDGGAVNTHSWNQGDLFGYDGRIDDNDVSILGLTYGLGVGNPLGSSPVGAMSEPAAATLAAPTEPAAQPAAALAPSPVALRASESSPVVTVLPSESGLVDGARQAPRAPAASDSAASSGAEALLAAAGASAASSGAVGPVAALEVTAMAPPLAWQSADRGERLPAADGGTLDLLSLPALAVLAGA